MNAKLLILFGMVNLTFAQFGPEFDGGAMVPQGAGEGEEYGVEGDNAEVPFESTQEGGAFEGGEYGAGPQVMQAGPGMIPNEQMQPYGGYNPAEESIHRPKFMQFRK